MGTFTADSSHPLNSIYERLRKRSLRAIGKQAISVLGGWKIRSGEFLVSSPYTNGLHASYVAGVRDALAAVEDQEQLVEDTNFWLTSDPIEQMALAAEYA